MYRYNYLPTYSLRQTFTRRINDTLIAMSSLARLLQIDDNTTYKTCYDELSDQFEKLTADIKTKDGVRIIDKDVNYYANGLITIFNDKYQQCESRLIGKPFSLASKQILNVDDKMATDIFVDEPYTAEHDCNKLFRLYLMTKISGKSRTSKLPKFPQLITKIETFKNTIVKPDLLTGSDDMVNRLIKTILDNYTAIVREYVDSIMFISSNNITTSPSGHISVNTQIAAAMSLYLNPCNIRRYYFYCNIKDKLVDKIPNLYLDADYENVKYWQFDNSRLLERCDTTTRRDIKYLSEKDVNELIDVMHKTYSQMYSVHETDEINKNSAMVINATNHDVTTNALKFYSEHVVSATSKKYKNDEQYKMLGAARMLCCVDIDNIIVSTINVDPHVLSACLRKNDDDYDADELLNRRMLVCESIIDSCDTMIDNINDITLSLNNVDNNDFKNWMIKKSVIQNIETSK